MFGVLQAKIRVIFNNSQLFRATQLLKTFTAGAVNAIKSAAPNSHFFEEVCSKK
jgi:hypothetical protein